MVDNTEDGGKGVWHSYLVRWWSVDDWIWWFGPNSAAFDGIIKADGDFACPQLSPPRSKQCQTYYESISLPVKYSSIFLQAKSRFDMHLHQPAQEHLDDNLSLGSRYRP